MGVPGMIALLAFLAFAIRGGFAGLMVGGVAVLIVYLVIGACVWMGKHLDEPRSVPPAPPEDPVQWPPTGL